MSMSWKIQLQLHNMQRRLGKHRAVHSKNGKPPPPGEGGLGNAQHIHIMGHDPPVGDSSVLKPLPGHK